MDAKELKAYRTKLYTDLYSGIVPDRIPVTDTFGLEFYIKYAGLDLMTTQYSLTKEKIVEVMEKTLTFARGDVFTTGSARNALGSFFQKSTMNVMSKSGFIQHPESSSLNEEEFDEYIKDPYKCIQTIIRPRSNGAYTDDPVMRCMNFARVIFATQEFSRTIAEANAAIAEKYGFMTAPPGTGGRDPVAFDNLADMTRGFSQIVLDIKRCPQKVLDAMEAFMPYAIYTSNKSKPHVLGSNNIMTHMGAFLRQSEFDKFYFPNFKKIVHISSARGQDTTIFLEADWTRFIDELTELPQGTRMFMEYGDAQLFKDKLGKKCALGGLYPLTLLKNGTKEQCVDKAKELLDIMAPGGNFFFRFDKSSLDPNDISIENYTAVMDYIFEHGKYDNPGTVVSDLKKEDTIHYGYDKEYPAFKSEYLPTFEEFSADYPPADERAVPLIKAAFQKYSSMAEAFFG